MEKLTREQMEDLKEMLFRKCEDKKIDVLDADNGLTDAEKKLCNAYLESLAVAIYGEIVERFIKKD